MILFPIGDINPRRRVPFVNYLLVAANVSLFVKLCFLDPPGEYELAVWNHGLVPSAWGWTDLFTSQFLHGGVAHLVGNMLFLWIAGDNVEDRLGHLGYPVFYLLCGAAAGLAHLAMNPGSKIPCIGASGAISGVMAAYALLFPRSRIEFFYWVVIFWGKIRIPSFVAIGLWFAEQLLYAMERSRLGDMPGVAYGAHVGGFVFGGAAVVLLLVFGYVQPQRRGR